MLNLLLLTVIFWHFGLLFNIWIGIKGNASLWSFIWKYTKAALSFATHSFHSVFRSILKSSMSLTFFHSFGFSLSVRFYPSVQSAGWEHGLNLCTGNTGNPMGFKIFLTFLCNALAFEVAPLLTETWSLWFKGAHFERKHMFIKKISFQSSGCEI